MLGPTGSGDVQLVVSNAPAQRYAIWAWSFLEDAERAMEREKNPAQRLLHVERYLSMAAVSLRSACEAHWHGNWNDVPDQALMNFVTAARHLTAHAADTPSHANPTRIHLQGEPQGGYFESEVILTLETAAAKLPSRQKQDEAKRYLARHDGNLFKALHAAVRRVAGWLGVDLDDDFERLGNANIGTIRFRVPFRDRAHFESIRDAIQEGRDFELGDVRNIPED